MKSIRFGLVLGPLSLVLCPWSFAQDRGQRTRDKPDEAALRKAVMLYASFDQAVRADYSQGGALTLQTRSNHPRLKNTYIVSSGIPSKAFRIAPGKGISGGALECLEVLPNNGRIFFPARLNTAFPK